MSLGLAWFHLHEFLSPSRGSFSFFESLVSGVMHFGFAKHGQPAVRQD
jgi:hypothetical protein